MNKRRELLIAIGALAFAAPFGSYAQQQGKVWRVGFLTLASRPVSLDSYIYGAFLQGMREFGYTDGKNLEMEWRFSEGKIELLPGLASELVQLKVDIIVTTATDAVRAVQKATSTTPIVMASNTDPVGAGLVKSLARPGGNITGLSNLVSDFAPKFLELLRSMVPKLSRVAVLVNSDSLAFNMTLTNIQAAAQAIGVTILPIDARTPQEIENAFFRMARQKSEALIVTRGPFFNQQRRQISELAIKNRLPTIGGLREYVEAGGLMSYGSSLPDQFRRAATYVDKIFKGAKPGDLPIEQPAKFETVINLKTAKLLGIKIPNSVLVRADEVIE